MQSFLAHYPSSCPKSRPHFNPKKVLWDYAITVQKSTLAKTMLPTWNWITRRQWYTEYICIVAISEILIEQDHVFIHVNKMCRTINYQLNVCRSMTSPWQLRRLRVARVSIYLLICKLRPDWPKDKIRHKVSRHIFSKIHFQWNRHLFLKKQSEIIEFETHMG